MYSVWVWSGITVHPFLSLRSEGEGEGGGKSESENIYYCIGKDGGDSKYQNLRCRIYG